MHIIQKTLIKRLMLSSSLRFSELTNGYTADDNVVFHLKKLLELNYIDKSNDLYSLTVEGVKKTNDYDWKNLFELGSKPLFVGFIAKYGDKYLLKRHNQAKTQFYNLPNGKPYHEKDIRDELVRIAKEEMSVVLSKEDFIYDSTHIKHTLTTDENVLFSDVFIVYKVEIKEINELPDNLILLNKDEIKMLPNKWQEIDYCILRKDWGPYLEYTNYSNYIL